MPGNILLLCYNSWLVRRQYKCIIYLSLLHGPPLYHVSTSVSYTYHYYMVPPCTTSVQVYHIPITTTWSPLVPRQYKCIIYLSLLHGPPLYHVSTSVSYTYHYYMVTPCTTSVQVYHIPITTTWSPLVPRQYKCIIYLSLLHGPPLYHVSTSVSYTYHYYMVTPCTTSVQVYHIPITTTWSPLVPRQYKCIIYLSLLHGPPLYHVSTSVSYTYHYYMVPPCTTSVQVYHIPITTTWSPLVPRQYKCIIYLSLLHDPPLYHVSTSVSYTYHYYMVPPCTTSVQVYHIPITITWSPLVPRQYKCIIYLSLLHGHPLFRFIPQLQY